MQGIFVERVRAYTSTDDVVSRVFARVFFQPCRYEGLVSEYGQCEKLGVFTYIDGDRYEGQYTEGMMHGHGVYTWTSDDSTYFGEWNNNSQSGCGVKLYGSGAVEVGEWKDDQYLGEYTGRCGQEEQEKAMLLAVEAAQRARMFTNKPDGEVVVLKNSIRPDLAENQHPVVYEKGTEWQMPGYKGEQYDVPEDLEQKQPKLYRQMMRFGELWERAWRYYNVDIPEGQDDAKLREVKFLSDEPQQLRTVDEEYDEYDDEDEDEDDEDEEPASRSRRSGPASLSLSTRNANPIAQTFARLGKNKHALRNNPLNKAAAGLFQAAREHFSASSKVTVA
mmetsp:Transcript_1515/g.3318  ORF Transcript_1515/g.3318 Transcript_1515/m.3318 type:complete len:334 (-) Transcript_1515:1693-2694(-)